MNAMSPKSKKYGAGLPLYTAFFTLILLISSCGENGKGETSRRPETRSAGPSIRIAMQSETPVLYGDTLYMEVRSGDTALAITEVSIGAVGFRGDFLTTTDETAAIPTAIVGGGDMRLRITAKFDDGQTASRYKEVNILAPEPPKDMQLGVVRKYDHDVNDFTQGFLVHDGHVIEGTGQYGQSRIKKWDLTTGEVLMEQPLAREYFGEGIAVFGDKLYQLTYKASRAFVYDVETFERVETHTYATETGEGWGLTANDTSLIMSDGSSWIYYFDPHSFREIHRVNVFDDRGSVEWVNELEFHNGLIYANVYTQNYILAIDPVSGRVVERISAAGIMDRSEATAGMDVFNGIAVHPETGNLLVTGKYWTKVYEVRVLPSMQP